MLRRVQALPWIHTAYDIAISLFVAWTAWTSGTDEDLFIGWAMALALVFRRRRPMTVMVAVSVLALVQYVLSSPAPYDVALFVAMLSVVTHARLMWHVYTAGAVVLLGVVVAFGGFLPFGEQDGDDFGFTLAGACAALWLTAMVLRTRRLYVATLEDRAATAEREREHLVQLAAAEERAEIARELHDVVAHSLAVMILQADGAGYVLKSDPDRAGTALKAIGDTGRDALEDMHRIVRVLRGGRASGQGDAPDADADRRRVSLDDLETVAERARAAGLRVTLEIEGDRGGLSTADELTVLRVVQESLTNVLRHAGPGAEVTISLRFDEDVVVIGVVDDGAGKLAGSRPAADRGTGGNGLVGMRERLEVSGGSFTAGPRLGAGWQVDAKLPVSRQADKPVRTTG
ncbi:sensor histidine kinase [Streptomyces spongiae]|uniref:histidine kinase n=1 Tax=Streptomyces spongiae TaxID=565072 RepID=A0A5N8XGK9_9ACTN|nr:histidine kinase [Streptomyces spongiae]MPY58374.1 sensor histidine kinase [Streptomyces spongiae]